MSAAGKAVFTLQSGDKTIVISIGNNDWASISATQEGREGAIELELIGEEAENFKEMMAIILDRSSFPYGRDFHRSFVD